ncbi:MAG: iron-containing alcohol dehydrogenase family protein, partial [bacterium]
MIDLFLAPRRYIQKKGVANRIGEFVLSLGRKPLVLTDRTVYGQVGEVFSDSLGKENLVPTFEQFQGECSRPEVERITNLLKRKRIDVVIGCGGGKAMDTAKAAACNAGLPIITFPTSAATCSGWSFIAPLYTEEGVYLKTLDLKRSPDLTLVDPEIIARAPVRLLSAGMGDALAKWYEARVSTEGGVKDFTIQLALDLAKKSHDLVEDLGPRAKQDGERKICSREVEEIIEVNILLTGLVSGLGKGRCRSLAAHALNYGMTHLEETRGALHGERVAFGVIMQLILEQRDENEIEKLLLLYSALDLPLTLKELGLSTNQGKLTRLVKEICKKESRIHNLPFPINESMVQEALLKADEWGRKI